MPSVRLIGWRCCGGTGGRNGDVAAVELVGIVKQAELDRAFDMALDEFQNAEAIRAA